MLSYPVSSANKYVTPFNIVNAKPLPPSGIRSMQGLKLTESSWPYDSSMPSNHYLISDGEKGIVVKKTANQLHAVTYDDFRKYGNFSPQLDDTRGFAGWKAACEDRPPNCFEYVKLPQTTSSSGVSVSLGERLADFDPRDTFIPKYVTDITITGTHNNRLGKRLSESWTNVMQPLRNYLRTHDGKELASYLSSLGLEPVDIDEIAVGFLPEGALYGVGRTKEGKVMLTSAWRALEKIADEARQLGAKPEDLLSSVLAEEITHVWGKDFDKRGSSIDIEIAAKENVRNHYERLAKGADGDPKKASLKRRYKRLAEIKKMDAETTPQRYSKSEGHAYMDKAGEYAETGEYSDSAEGSAAESGNPKRMSRMSKLELIAESGKAEAKQEAKAEASGE